MNAVTSTNAGFLWKVGESGSIYLTNTHAERSPFTNQKFVEAFEKAQVIAFKFKRECEEKNISLSEVSKLGSKKLSKLAKYTEEYITENELKEYSAKLEQLIQTSEMFQNIPDIEMPSFDNPREQFFFLFFLSLFSRCLLKIDAQDFQQDILLKAQEAGKEVVYLTSSDKIKKSFHEQIKALFKSPLFYFAIKKVFLSEDWLEKLRHTMVSRGQAWDTGFFSAMEEMPLVSYTDDKQLEKLYKEEFGENRYEMDNRLSKAHLINHNTKTDIQRIKQSQKIAGLFKKQPALMFIDSDIAPREFFVDLALLQVPIEGPLRNTMKPIGYLWEIRKTEKIVGYFLGSIHIVPQWILENCNSAILHAFDVCDVLGVEVDVTRKDVQEAMKTKRSYMDLCFPGYQKDKRMLSIVGNIVKEGLEVHQINLNNVTPDEFLPKAIELLGKAIAEKFGTKSGIDFFFIEKAKQRQIEIVDLETIETHVERGDLSFKENDGTIFAFTYKAFEAKFQKVICQYYPEIYEMGIVKLLENKYSKDTEKEKQLMALSNMEMALTTDKLIKKGKFPLSIAGGFHYTGPDSILKNMEKIGYTTNQVICEEPRI